MLQHGGRVLLADEMGLGKTLQVLKYQPFLFSLYFVGIVLIPILICEKTYFVTIFGGFVNFFFWIEETNLNDKMNKKFDFLDKMNEQICMYSRQGLKCHISPDGQVPRYPRYVGNISNTLGD